MVAIDSLDLKILAELVNNSKASYSELGRKLGLHPNVIAYRVNKLERSGVITEYTAHLDLEKLGLGEQIFVGASFPGNSQREEVLEQIATIPQTVKVISSLGEPESIVFLVGKNKEEVDRVMTKLRKLNLRIEYTGSIIKVYEEGKLGNFLKELAKEADQLRSSREENGREIKQEVAVRV